MYYYGIAGGFGIDLIIETRKKTLSQKAEIVCVEIKSAKKWDKRWCELSASLAHHDHLSVKSRWGVYRGKEELGIKGMRILPVNEFLKLLFAEKVF